MMKSIKSYRFTNLYGLSGMGKTVLSKRIKKVLKTKSYKTIWINWDHISLDEQINNILRRERCLSFHDLVGKNKQFVIFVDNYDGNDLSNLKDKFKDLLLYRDVKFVITSKNKILNANLIQVNPFSETEALSLMLKYFPQQEKGRLKRIVGKLGRYPYFITNICLAIENSNTLNLDRLESMLESDPKEIINKDFTMDEKISMYQNSLGNLAIKKMIEDLKENDPKAHLTLGFISILNSKSIPLQLIHDFIGNEKEGDSIIEKLSTYPMFSSINKKNKYISYDLHEITQKIIFETLSSQDKAIIRDSLTDTFMRFYDKDFPKISLSNEEDQFFFNHLFSAIEKYKEDQRILPLRILAIKRSIYSGETSKDEFKESLKIEKLYPEKVVDNQLILFEYHVDWAYLYCFGHGDEQEKFEKGIEFGKKALNIAEKHNDVNRIFKASTRLIWVNLYAGRVSDSQYYLEKATELLPQIDDSYLRKEYYFASSWYYLDSGDFQQALSLASQGVKLDDLSKSFYVGLYIRCFKAVAEYRIGLMNNAQETLEEALRREYSAFKNNPSLARAELLQAKSMVSIGKGDLISAEHEIVDSINIFKKEYGDKPYHPTAISMKILSEILLQKGDILQSRNVVCKAINMFKDLIKVGGTYEFGEALLLKSKIDVMLKDYDGYLDVFHEAQARFKNENTLLLKSIQEVALSNKCEWLLGS